VINTFDGNGSFACTKMTNPATPDLFLRIQQ